MAAGDQFLDDGRAYEAGRAGNENTHGKSPVIELERNIELHSSR
jgi:hypothetical protein